MDMRMRINIEIETNM